MNLKGLGSGLRDRVRGFPETLQLHGTQIPAVILKELPRLWCPNMRYSLNSNPLYSSLDIVPLK